MSRVCSDCVRCNLSLLSWLGLAPEGDPRGQSGGGARWLDKFKADGEVENGGGANGGAENHPISLDWDYDAEEDWRQNLDEYEQVASPRGANEWMLWLPLFEDLMETFRRRPKRVITRSSKNKDIEKIVDTRRSRCEVKSSH
uniref:Uncharacterized protein n=1 Tax=Pseudictyota dubia TaxID=2749911 RepID=A0A7R9Z9Z6_9STRA